ncbi:MAG: carboxypeptidase-like regulatory domain-containing protein [Planctomycetia bacterium]|nr:carboxypeptidase-like regulatory domain-containing protein [Planctomycetia bacterium]
MTQSQIPRPGLLSAGLMILLATAAGCGGKYTPVPVDGVVTHNGQPVEGATVNFFAIGDEKDGRPAHGTTNKEGEFRLSTLGDEDGALPRRYKVVVTKYVPTNPNLKIPDFPDTVEGQEDKSNFMYRNFEAKGIQPFKNVLPAVYGDSNTTPLEYEITKSTTIKIELTGN